MTEVPADTPVTMPEDEPTVAMDGLPLLQVPPPLHERMMVEPTQTLPEPVMGPGDALTVTTAVMKQPVGSV